VTQSPPRWVGQSLRRTEDPRLLTGAGRFIDDLAPEPGMVQAAILRSPHAHARVVSVDAAAALRLPGVLGVLTGEDIRRLSRPFPLAVSVPVAYYAAAVDRVRFVGEPVAVVVAESRYLAEDALDLIEVDYDVLPPVLDPEAALAERAPLLHEQVGSNVGNHRSFEFGDPSGAFAEADLVVEERFSYSRYSSLPIETYGLIAHHDRGSGLVTIWSNFHGPFVLHSVVAGGLGIPGNQLRFIIPPEIGGSFGIKSGIYPYMVLVALASRAVGRPVKWIEDRREHLLASCSGTDRISYVRAAFRRDGELIGLEYRFLDNVGAYIRSPEPATMFRCFGNFTGAYAVRNVQVETYSIMTNKAPTGLNRGFGGPQLYFPLERVMDLAAEQLGHDPAELRRRNLVPANAFPYRTPLGGVYDSGNYQAVLERALERSGYRDLRAEQQRARAEGRRVGIGLASIVDPSGTNMGYITLAQTHEERARQLPKSGCTESSTITMDPSGGITVRLTTTPEGQGHETVATQVVADELGVPPERVRVLAEMDTLTQPWTITTGSYSSRFGPLGTSAIALAARKLRDKLGRIAAHALEADPGDLDLVDGNFVVRGAPERLLALRHAAGIAHWNAASLPVEIDPGLQETGFYSLPIVSAPNERDEVDSSATYAFVTDIVAVEVNPDTYDVKILSYTTVHDAGRILNPMLVEGQIYGATIHGLGGALYEQLRYGADGQLLTGSLMDYLCPTAQESPSLLVDHLETPSPLTLLGAKGVGEGNCMSTPPAIANAVADALGLRVTELPLTPDTLFQALSAASHPAASILHPSSGAERP
jgi:2-furoyl-CoA dehydrogenase large subunit